MLRLVALILFVGLCVAQPPRLHAAERVALVIGNGKYQHATELLNPRNDAEEMASVLGGLGFEVIKGIDLNHDDMESKIRAFARAVRPAKLALFFYAGHGMQVNGRNFLIPVDAELADSTALDFEAIDADQVFRYMGSADRVALAFLDACRNNPLARRFARTLGPTRSATVGDGLAAPSTTGTGLFIAFATAPNDVALDGEGSNSPFTQALLKHLPSPGLEIQQLMTRVKADVSQATAGDQRPWHSSDLQTDVYLFPQQAVDPEQEDPLAADFAIARVVNSKAGWETFLARHGENEDSFYVQLAKAALDKLALGIFPPVEEPETDNPAPMEQTITECDRLAAMHANPANPPGLAGIATETLVLNAPAAIRACREAVAGHPHMSRFLLQLGRALGAAEQWTEAREQYEKAAALGDAAATGQLGRMYQLGQGAPLDHREARRIFERAAALGSPDAMYRLGKMYHAGQAVRQDYYEARRWYQEAAALGVPGAMMWLGFLYANGSGVTQDYQEARRWYEKAAALAFPPAMNDLGEVYYTGTGVPQSYREARQWYEKSAALGNTFAMMYIGGMYWDGKGAEQSHQEASRWFERAAEVGGPTAMFHIGLMYANGAKVSQDYREARLWYEKAAALGNASAMTNLGVIYGEGSGVPKDDAEARQWYEKGAALGNTYAILNLAFYLSRGDGGPRDVKRAGRLYVESLRSRNSSAILSARLHLVVLHVELRRAVQRFLVEEGYLKGGVDGVIGPATAAALESYLAGDEP